MTKKDVQDFAKKYLNAEVTMKANSDYYGEYERELVALLKWDGKNTIVSSNIQKYIYDNSGSKSYVVLKEFKKGIPQEIIDSAAGEIIGLYSATEESTKNWVSSNSPDENVRKTYKNKKFPAIMLNKKLDKFYKIYEKENNGIMNTIIKEIELNNENNIEMS